MPTQKHDEELKLTRRLFLQHSATAAAMSATVVGIALKTDAVAQNPPPANFLGGDRGDGMPYPYHEP